MIIKINQTKINKEINHKNNINPLLNIKIMTHNMAKEIIIISTKIIMIIIKINTIVTDLHMKTIKKLASLLSTTTTTIIINIARNISKINLMSNLGDRRIIIITIIIITINKISILINKTLINMITLNKK